MAIAPTSVVDMATRSDALFVAEEDFFAGDDFDFAEAAPPNGGGTSGRLSMRKVKA